METDTISHEIQIRVVVKNGKRRLPSTIPCMFCYGSMHRLRFRTKPTFRCDECDADTILETELR